jgi:hypothetical protein
MPTLPLPTDLTLQHIQARINRLSEKRRTLLAEDPRNNPARPMLLAAIESELDTLYAQKRSVLAMQTAKARARRPYSHDTANDQP